jgi:hypothetical protein
LVRLSGRSKAHVLWESSRQKYRIKATPKSPVLRHARSTEKAPAAIRALQASRLRAFGYDEIVEVTPEELGWGVVTSEQRKLGKETTHAAHFFMEGGSVLWTVTQYPDGALVMTNTYPDNVEILHDFAISLTG